MEQAGEQVDRAIGERVHALRAAAKMTLEGLAERSGVSRAMLSRIERGESSADRWQVEQRIAHAENQLAVAGRS